MGIIVSSICIKIKMQQNTKIKVDLSKYENNISLKNKLGRFIWNIAYIFLFRPFPSKIFRKYRNLVLNIFGAKIHQSALVFASTHIWAPWNLEMEEYSLIGDKVDCYNPAKIKLESYVVVSQKVYLCTASHDITSSKHPLITSPILIKSQSWIAADSFVGMGVIIGEGAVVGARACVFKNVEPWTVVGGNPAKFIKKRVIKE